MKEQGTKAAQHEETKYKISTHLYVEVLKCFEMQIAALCAASQFYCLTLKLCLSTDGPWNTISSYNNTRDCSPNLLKIETSSYYRFLPEYLVTEAGNAAHSHPWSRPCSTAALQRDQS